MNSPVSQILFYFSYLFSTPFTFVSEESNIAIDLTNKMGRIEYVNLETPSEAINQAVTGLREMDSITQFDEYYDHLKLISKDIYVSKKKLNATMEFSFENLNESLETLSFYLLPNGNWAHPILAYERVISSNGKIIKEEDINYVLWNRETKIIEMKVKHVKLEENHLLDMVSLHKYWKE